MERGWIVAGCAFGGDAFAASSDSGGGGGGVAFGGFGALDRARSDGNGDGSGDSRLLKSFARSQSEPTSN